MFSDFIAEQSSDAKLKVFIDYVRDGKLPEDEKAARKVVFQGKFFDIVDGILHHENPLYPGRWCVAVPGKRREDLIREAHDRVILQRRGSTNFFGGGIGGHECRLMLGSIVVFVWCVLQGRVMVVRSGQLCSLSL